MSAKNPSILLTLYDFLIKVSFFPIKTHFINISDRNQYLNNKKDSPQSVNTSPKLQSSPPPGILTAGIHQVLILTIFN